MHGIAMSVPSQIHLGAVRKSSRRQTWTHYENLLRFIIWTTLIPSRSNTSSSWCSFRRVWEVSRDMHILAALLMWQFAYDGLSACTERPSIYYRPRPISLHNCVSTIVALQLHGNRRAIRLSLNKSTSVQRSLSLFRSTPNVSLPSVFETTGCANVGSRGSGRRLRLRHVHVVANLLSIVGQTYEGFKNGSA